MPIQKRGRKTELTHKEKKDAVSDSSQKRRLKSEKKEE